MSSNIFIPNKNKKSNFRSLFDLSTVSSVQNTQLFENKHSKKLFEAVQKNIQTGGTLDSIKNSSVKDILSSEIPVHTDDIEQKIQSLFVSDSNHNSKPTQEGGSKRSVVNGSRVFHRHTLSDYLEGGENAGLKAHRDLVEYIQKKMNLKGGPQLQKFAAVYKNAIKEKFPNMNSIEQSKKAMELFDEDSDANRKKKYEKAGDALKNKKSKSMSGGSTKETIKTVEKVAPKEIKQEVKKVEKPVQEGGKAKKVAKKVEQDGGENDGLKAHRKLVEHIQKDMDIPGGPQLQVFAKMYKDVIKNKNPDMNSIDQSAEAIKLFDKDSESNKKEKYAKAKDLLAEKKKTKKAKKAKKAKKESVADVDEE